VKKKSQFFYQRGMGFGYEELHACIFVSIARRVGEEDEFFSAGQRGGRQSAPSAPCS
jgi:hypothetical protein